MTTQQQKAQSQKKKQRSAEAAAAASLEETDLGLGSLFTLDDAAAPSETTELEAAADESAELAAAVEVFVLTIGLFILIVAVSF